VALNGHAATAEARLNEADLLDSTIADAGRSCGLSRLGHNDFVPATIMMVMVVGERMHDPVGGSLDSTAEAVVLTLVVVVTHISSDWLVDLDLFLFNDDFGVGTASLVLDVVGRIHAATVFALSHVELVLVGLVVGLTAIVLNVNVLVAASTVDLDINVGGLVLGRSSVPGVERVSRKGQENQSTTGRTSQDEATYFSRESSTSG
jgi:hypothetical protein